ncbi:hypothetical protein ACJOV8_001420 [Formosa sp. 3Alg 14/1]|uniref:hypothetical protein n=1 Tax=Formosa sp. 3Alg 14/1 TaxID=3382190 RepID=UPI0039BDFC1E
MGFRLSPKDLSLINILKYTFNPISIFGTKKKLYVSALGITSCGKTTLQNYLRHENYMDATIGSNDIRDIVLRHGFDIIALTKGKDVSGSTQATKSYNEDEFYKSDICYYIFNSKNLLENADYCDEVVGRLNFLNKLNVKQKPKEKTKIILLASHFDTLKGTNQEKMIIWNKIENIANEGHLTQPMYVNLKNKEDLKKIKTALFNGI